MNGDCIDKNCGVKEAGPATTFHLLFSEVSGAFGTLQPGALSFITYQIRYESHSRVRPTRSW